MDPKYAPFKRMDLERFSSPCNLIALFFLAPSFIIRLVIGYIAWVPMMAISWVLSFFQNDHSMVKGRIYDTLRFMQMFVARWNIGLAACWPGMMN